LARLEVSNDRQCAHVHEQRSVAVEAEHPSSRIAQRHPQRNRGRMAHATDGQKVALNFVTLDSKLEDLARGLARRGHDDIIRVGELEDLAQRVLALERAEW
jgi:hypothetical protein